MCIVSHLYVNAMVSSVASSPSQLSHPVEDSVLEVTLKKTSYKFTFNLISKPGMCLYSRISEFLLLQTSRSRPSVPSVGTWSHNLFRLLARRLKTRPAEAVPVPARGRSEGCQVLVLVSRYGRHVVAPLLGSLDTVPLICQVQLLVEIGLNGSGCTGPVSDCL